MFLPRNKSCAAPAGSCPSPENFGARQYDSSPRKVTLSLSSLWFSIVVWSESNFSPVLWELLPVILYIMKTSEPEAVFNSCSEVGHPAVSGPQHWLLSSLLALFCSFCYGLFIQGDLSLMDSSCLLSSLSLPSWYLRGATNQVTVSLLRYNRHG